MVLLRGAAAGVGAPHNANAPTRFQEAGRRKQSVTVDVPPGGKTLCATYAFIHTSEQNTQLGCGRMRSAEPVVHAVTHCLHKLHSPWQWYSVQWCEINGVKAIV